MAEEYATLVQEIAAKENIENPRLLLHATSNKGDGYLGCIKFGKIAGDNNKSLDVVIKCAHRDPKVLGKVVNMVYLNETRFYNKIFPAFQKFQEEHQVSEPYDNVAKFYGAITEPGKETLILENLKTDNYEMWDRKKLMDEIHLTCALQTFAKYHATSFAMQKLNPGLYEDIIQGLEENLFTLVCKDTMKYTAQLKEIVKDISFVFNPETEPSYCKKMEQLAMTVTKDMEEVMDFTENSVILQGDCWCTNSMFQYEDLGRKEMPKLPKKMKMLDFQMVKLASPVLDLTYFFYAAASKKCVDRLDEFLKIYHNALAEHLRKFQLDVEEIFGFEQFLTHWRKVSKYGLFMTFGVRKVMLVESQEAPDFTEGPEVFIEGVKIEGNTKKLYYQQMKELIVHFMERKFI